MLLLLTNQQLLILIPQPDKFLIKLLDLLPKFLIHEGSSIVIFWQIRQVVGNVLYAFGVCELLHVLIVQVHKHRVTLDVLWGLDVRKLQLNGPLVVLFAILDEIFEVFADLIDCVSESLFLWVQL